MAMLRLRCIAKRRARPDWVSRCQPEPITSRVLYLNCWKLTGICRGADDEVIVPSNTYIATVLAVTYTGATPVLAEPLEDTCNLDPEAFRACITPRTKVVIPVHLYGQPCDMGSIMAIAKQHGIHVIEDNAQ